MEGWPINGFDIAVILIILSSAILAVFRGFFREFLSIVGWVGAIFVMLYGAPFLLPYTEPYIKNELINLAIAYAAIFIFSLFLFSLLAHYLAKLVQGSSLGPIDRSFGFIFGVIRGMLVVALLYMVLIWVWPEDKHASWIKQAKTVPYIMMTSNWVKTLLPQTSFMDHERDGSYQKNESLDQLFSE